MSNDKRLVDLGNLIDDAAESLKMASLIAAELAFNGEPFAQRMSDISGWLSHVVEGLLTADVEAAIRDAVARLENPVETDDE